MRRVWLLLLSSALLLPVFAGNSVALADSPADYAISQGHFYRQGTPSIQSQPNAGYAITDEGGIPFWSEFQRLGGVDALGYPVSGRFVVGGNVAQLTQKVGLAWHPEVGQVRFLNIFTLLHDAGRDPWLLLKGIPPQASWPNEAGKSWADVAQSRYKLLDTNPAIKAAYFAAADPVNMYGLPTSSWLDQPVGSALRFEDVVFQQWKITLPWATPGQVQMANGGDILKESGVLGETPFVTAAPPPALQAVPAGFAVASFYADAFDGRYTSSGEVFSQSKMIAATNSFPLGARLRLSTPDGKHSVDVVNKDHPPYWNSRIDLSKAAFQELYPLSSGIGDVRIDVIQ